MQGQIEITHVSFAYPARPELQVFRNLSLSIPAGQTTALVGPSGCGKSTIVQLLQRFYDPAAGTITVDGIDVRKLSLKWYRDQVCSETAELTENPQTPTVPIYKCMPSSFEAKLAPMHTSWPSSSYMTLFGNRIFTTVSVFRLDLSARNLLFLRLLSREILPWGYLVLLTLRYVLQQLLRTLRSSSTSSLTGLTLR